MDSQPSVNMFRAKFFLRRLRSNYALQRALMTYKWKHVRNTAIIQNS